MLTFNKTCTHYMWVVAETVLQDGVENGLAMWRQWMAPKRDCANGCLFGLNDDNRVCAQCLEGRLRTMNLYHPAPPSGDCPYLRAAEAIKLWLDTGPKTNPVAA